jgi:hypothetical protein
MAHVKNRKGNLIKVVSSAISEKKSLEQNGSKEQLTGGFILEGCKKLLFADKTQMYEKCTKGLEIHSSTLFLVM